MTRPITVPFRSISTPSVASSSVAATEPLLARLRSIFPSILTTIVQGEIVVKVSSTQLVPLLTLLKQHTGREFQQLIDLTAVDYPERKQRFEVVYALLSLSTNRRLTVVVPLTEGGYVPSVVSLYSSAGWYEREAWDRFGIVFRGHPDLRRLRVDYGFKGHPLRKDFPLTGYVEVAYSDFYKRRVYSPVSLAQEARLFSLDATWGGTI